MTAADLSWTAQLMATRRDRYAQYSPTFWRPARGVLESHAPFLRLADGRPDAISLRTACGFIIASPQDRRCVVDDFAVEDDAPWASEGEALLVAACRARTEPWQRCLTRRTSRSGVGVKDIPAATSSMR
jgi:hypothetical protein